MIFYPFSFEQDRVVFSTDQTVFDKDGSMTITFHGIKNDTTRSGVQVVVPPANNPLLDPVECLQDCMCRTANVRDTSDQLVPVFLSLHSPYKALSAQSIASASEDCITAAGLDRTLYSVKSFRLTEATVAIDEGINPKTVMKMGRWKTETVFFDH